MHSGGERLCVSKTACVSEMARVGEIASVGEMECFGEAACVEETPRVTGTACVSSMVCVGDMACFMEEARCVRETVCVRERYEREMTVGMREHATACESVMVRCVSVMARRSACVEWRRRRHQTKRDKGRVAAVVISKTALGLHGSERKVRAVLRTRPPRARLRE